MLHIPLVESHGKLLYSINSDKKTNTLTTVAGEQYAYCRISHNQAMKFGQLIEYKYFSSKTMQKMRQENLFRQTKKYQTWE